MRKAAPAPITTTATIRTTASRADGRAESPDRVNDRASEEEPLPPVDVGEAARDDEQCGVGEAETDKRPLELTDRGVELLVYRGDREDDRPTSGIEVTLLEIAIAPRMTHLLRQPPLPPRAQEPERVPQVEHCADPNRTRASRSNAALDQCAVRERLRKVAERLAARPDLFREDRRGWRTRALSNIRRASSSCPPAISPRRARRSTSRRLLRSDPVRPGTSRL